MELDKLIKRLSTDSRALLEKAVAQASSRSHFSIEIEHWLFEMISNPSKDTEVMLSHFDISQEALLNALSTRLELIKTGNDGFPKISQDIARLLFESWMLASSEYNSLEIYDAHVLLACAENTQLRLKLSKMSAEFEKLSAEDIRSQCLVLLEKTQKNGSIASQTDTSSISKTPALNQFAIDMTEQARVGKIDNIIGRDNEIRQMIDILCRRKQNNPILTGEAGVGKTAVVEGLAIRLANGVVPDNLVGTKLYSLDLGLLQAGAGVKGEFENRLKNVIKEVQQSTVPIILFIDEAHTLIGAGNQAGAGDAANLLKPALARGELRTIAATTWAEYKKYFETDAAMTRRFQVVKVDEPSEELAIRMLRNTARVLEEHHQVSILDEAISSAVVLSSRYITGRQLPDKCVSLLDTACARVGLSLATKPGSLETFEKTLESLVFQISRLEKESENGIDHSQLIAELEVKKAAVESSSSEIQAQWEKEQTLIKTIGKNRKTLEKLRLENQSDDAEMRKQQQKEINQLLKVIKKDREKLSHLQGSQPLMFECVDAQVVAEVVADWTGIPVGRMQADEIDNILTLQDTMEQRVVGQPHALQRITKVMRTASAKLGDPTRPLGVFMLVGPSGVGKTETALALAEQLYGSEKNMTVINMSEFKEEHKVSLLMGSPPGYVGYGEGGILTEAVRRKPYSVVLLDEVEKAHPGVQDIFYQVFDKGILRDGEGRDIDFKNTVILMTSNTASEQIEQLCMDPDTKPEPDDLLAAINGKLRETYKPAFLGRINIIPYYPLDASILEKIALMQLDAISERIRHNYQVPFSYSEKLLNRIVEQCEQSDVGARQISMLLNNTLLPQIAEQVLTALAKEEPFSQVVADIDKSGLFTITLSQMNKRTAAKKTVKKRAVSEL